MSEEYYENPYLGFKNSMLNSIFNYLSSLIQIDGMIIDFFKLLIY